ncbi:hypothetical protein LINPERHAP2_LOCUS43911, partial [Linum perenne]
MAPGLPKKVNRSSVQASMQREHATSILKRNTILNAPTVVDRALEEKGRKKTFQSTLNMKGASSARALAFMKAYRDVVNDVNGKKAAAAPGMESSSNASQRVATSNMATPHLDDTLTSQANLTPSQGNLGGSPTGTASSAAGENAEEQMDQNDESLVARKRVRGLTRGLGLCKRNRREANKLKVFIDPMFGRALIPYHSVKVGNELGQIAPSYLWPIRKNKSVRRQIYGDVLLKLQGKLNIENIRDVAVQEKIWKHFLTIVRCRRQRCHQTYKEKGRTGKPSNVPESTWNSLCDYWNEEKVKIICAKNKANRSNLAKPHTEGPVCFVASYHEEREKQGGALNLIEFWKKSHTKKSGEWATDACR